MPFEDTEKDLAANVWSSGVLEGLWLDPFWGCVSEFNDHQTDSPLIPMLAFSSTDTPQAANLRL